MQFHRAPNTGFDLIAIAENAIAAHPIPALAGMLALAVYAAHIASR
jgi:hypothetical protein